jgi:CRISPR/Cas system-associated exonuclease Cas4 (RecB family)
MTQAVDLPPIADLLNQGLQVLDKQRHERFLASKGLPPDAPEPPRAGLYVSEVRKVLGDSACWRELFYTVHGAPRDPLTREQRLAFAIGDRIERLYMDALAATGRLEKVQVPTPFEGHPVSGRLDALLRPGDRRVVEVKSVTVKQWHKIPKREHLDQTLMYVYGVRTLQGYADVPGGVTVYVAKDAPKGHAGVKEEPVDFDAPRMKEILESFSLAWVVASGDAIPQRPVGYTMNAWPCAYCAFKTHCWSDRDA